MKSSRALLGLAAKILDSSKSTTPKSELLDHLTALLPRRSFASDTIHRKSAQNVRLAPVSQYRSSTLKPIAFCTLAGGTFFTVACLAEEQKLRRDWHNFRSGVLEWAGGRKQSTSVSRLPEPLQNLAKSIQERWQSVPQADRAVYTIIAANVAVFGLFRVPFLANFMRQNFIHHLPPVSNRAITLLTSNFAHVNPWHLGVNMLAFLSFGRAAAQFFGTEQFSAFYLTAGLASGLASQLGRVRSRPGGASLGASGAVIACFAATALLSPDTEVVLMFLPMFPFKIGDMLPVMVALDLAGVLLRWRLFDHYGHLGGAAFGYFYTKYGEAHVWPAFQDLAQRLIAVTEERK